MPRQIFFYDSLTNGFRSSYLSFLFQGAFLILLGLTIWVFPKLLVAVVSLSFILVGVVLLFLGFKTRSLAKN